MRIDREANRMPKKIPPLAEPAAKLELPTPPCKESQTTTLMNCLFSEAVKQAPVAISITDKRANILYVNQAFSEITGYAQEESIGHNESMLSDRCTPPTVYQELWQRLQDKQIWQGRLVNRHKEGARYLAEVTIAPILDDQGETSHFIGMHRDITHYYSLERQVVNQKVLIESVVDSMPMAMVLLDETDRIVLDNQMYKTLTSDLGMREPSRIFLQILRDEMGPLWDQLKTKQTAFNHRTIRFDRGGRHAPRWFECSGTWFTRGDDSVDGFFKESRHTYLLLTLNDVTQRKRQEEELRINALKAMMAEEEKIQSLRETLSAAIHHMQGPVNLLNAARTMLMRRAPEQQNPALLDILDQILLAGEQSIGQLTNCIPEATDLTMTRVNLNQLLHECIVLLTDRLLARGIVVDWKPTPVLPTLMGYENRLRAMFKQIIENAIDAMNQGGSQRELRISSWSDKELIHVCIDDTGPGIPEHLHVKVFEPFFSTRSSGARRHSGMGLAMAQEVINQHLGLIRIDPNYKEGCRVHIQFNLHQKQTVQERPYAHG